MSDETKSLQLYWHYDQQITQHNHLDQQWAINFPDVNECVPDPDLSAQVNKHVAEPFGRHGHQTKLNSI